MPKTRKPVADSGGRPANAEYVTDASAIRPDSELGVWRRTVAYEIAVDRMAIHEALRESRRRHTVRVKSQLP